MIFSEYQELGELGLDLGLDSSLVVSGYGVKCAVNDYIALELSLVSGHYPRDQVIEIRPENSSATIAYLVTCGGTQFEYGKASEFTASAYLEDVKSKDLLLSGPRGEFIFKSDYLVIHSVEESDYIKKYRQGSGLWGGFLHVEELRSKPQNYQSTLKPIQAYENIIINKPQEQDILWRAIQHSSPLERYLKLYHLIELIFDLDLVEEIRNLGSDLKGIGKLLNDYSGDKEIDRITKISRKYCDDINKYESFLKQAFSDSSYHLQIIEILFEYSKDSNPYKDRVAEFKTTITNGFSVSELKNNKLNNDLNHLSKLTAYFIYRVRCGIAHSKIGEYILTQADEKFVAEVAEPLLRSILIEIYD